MRGGHGALLEIDDGRDVRWQRRRSHPGGPWSWVLALRLLDRLPPPQAAALEGALALRPSTGGDRFAVGAATLGLLAAYADESPALLLVDDAHLLDASSAEGLLFALRRLLAEPLGVVMAVRDGEPSALSEADLPSLSLTGLDLESA